MNKYQKIINKTFQEWYKLVLANNSVKPNERAKQRRLFKWCRKNLPYEQIKEELDSYRRRRKRIE